MDSRVMAALREPPKSKLGSTPRTANGVRLRHSQQDADHLHRQLRGDVDHEVERHSRQAVEQRARGPQIVLDAADHARRQPGADQPADLRMPRIVHHVEHLAGDRQILQQRPPYGRAAGHRRVGLRIPQHRKGFGVGRDRPETLAVGGVARSARASTPAPRGDGCRTGRAESRRRSCPDR